MVLLSLFADHSFPRWMSGSIWGFLIKTIYCTTLSFICIMCRGEGSTSGVTRFIVPWSSVYLICSIRFKIKICLLCKDSFISFIGKTKENKAVDHVKDHQYSSLVILYRGGAYYNRGVWWVWTGVPPQRAGGPRAALRKMFENYVQFHDFL